MSIEKRRRKRRSKIAQNPENVRFEDLSRLLEDYGFVLKRSKGSHHSFVGYVKETKMTLVIPFRRPLQEIYVKNVLAILDEIDPLTESDDMLEESDFDDEP
jgi:predicted RNA binding protein YcfA (HicA-like mRNA interferase family)